MESATISRDNRSVNACVQDALAWLRQPTKSPRARQGTLLFARDHIRAAIAENNRAPTPGARAALMRMLNWLSADIRKLEASHA